MIDKNQGLINSIDDLRDERGKNIAKQYKLDVKEILPRYSKLQREFENKNLEIELSKDNISLNVFDKGELIKNLACGAIICYELTQRESVRFPNKNFGIFGLRGKFNRDRSVESYETFGDYCADIIDILTSL